LFPSHIFLDVSRGDVEIAKALLRWAPNDPEAIACLCDRANGVPIVLSWGTSVIPSDSIKDKIAALRALAEVGTNASAATLELQKMLPSVTPSLKSEIESALKRIQKTP
jgi:hypothetical protein